MRCAAVESTRDELANAVGRGLQGAEPPPDPPQPGGLGHIHYSCRFVHPAQAGSHRTTQRPTDLMAFDTTPVCFRREDI